MSNKELDKLKEDNEFIDKIIDKENTLEELQEMELEELLAQEDYLSEEVDEYPEVNFHEDHYQGGYEDFFSDSERDDWE